MRVRYLVVVCLLMTFMLATIPAVAQEPSVCDGPTGNPAPPMTDIYVNGSASVAGKLVDFLNVTGSPEALVDAIESSSSDEAPVYVMVIQADLTGEGIDDVLVQISFQFGQHGGYSDEVFSLFTCENGSYRHLGTQTVPGYAVTTDDRPTQIWLTTDLNNNQIRDIVAQIATLQGTKIFSSLIIFEWDGAALAQILQVGPSYGAFQDVRVSNRDDNPATLQLSVGYFYAYEQETATAFIELSSARPIDMLYTWDGATFALECKHFTDQPATRVEILHSAETLRACGFYDQASVFYRQLWDDAAVLSSHTGTWLAYPASLPVEDYPDFADDLERAYLRAFAGYRLMQIALYNGDNLAASRFHNDLIADYPTGKHGYVYAAMAVAFWESYQSTTDFDAACEIAAETFKDVWQRLADPGIEYDEEAMPADEGSVYGFYFDNGRRYGANPDNLFIVPDEIDSMISTPVCLWD